MLSPIFAIDIRILRFITISLILSRSSDSRINAFLRLPGFTQWHVEEDSSFTAVDPYGNFTHFPILPIQGTQKG